MGDMMTVRDHSQPCEHGFLGDVGDANQRCNWYKRCPGGKEIRLRKARYYEPDWDYDTVWVEVDDED